MIQRKVMRRLWVTASSVAFFLGERTAFADDREQCAASADQAQQLRDEGKYRRAREQLLLCARDTCPGPIKRDCLEWLSQLENTASTVVFVAKEGTKDLSDVKVSVDGLLVSDRLDGKPVPIDLGQHTVKFEYRGQSKEETLLVSAGQKNRNVTVTFGAPPAVLAEAVPGNDTRSDGSKSGGSGSLVPALVVGGIGVLALGSFAFFGLGGQSDVSHLESTCKPNCAQSDVDSANTKLLIADVSLVAGVAALGVATYLFLTRSHGHAPAITSGRAGLSMPLAPASDPKRRAASSRGLSFDVAAHVRDGGGVALVGARF